MTSFGPESGSPGDFGSPPPMGSSPIEKKQSGAMGYWLGGGMVLVGVVLAAVMIIVSVQRVGKAIAFPDAVNSSGSITLTGTGQYTVYVIEPVPFSGSSISVSTSKPAVTVRGPDGDAIPTTVADGLDTTVSRGNLQARKVANFEADREGDYRIVGSPMEPGQSLGAARSAPVHVGQLLLGFAAAGILFIAGIVMLIVTAVRRKPPSPSGPGIGPPPGYPGQWYPPYPPGGTQPPGPWQPMPPPGSGAPAAPGQSPGPWGQPPQGQPPAGPWSHPPQAQPSAGPWSQPPTPPNPWGQPPRP